MAIDTFDTRSTIYSAENEHIPHYLDYYLSLPQEAGNAVLISGEWGSGKTYLVQSYLKNKFSDENRYLYVSLFGASTKGDIDAAILAAAYPIFTSSKVKILGAAARIALKSGGVNLDIDPKEFVVRKNSIVYIFDDLERADLNMNVALGYINEFSEQDQCKTIILANEKELYDSEYNYRKEKVIGKTLKVKPDINSVVESFISSIEERNLINFIKSQRSLISAIFYQSGYQNLRLLTYTLRDFERVYECLGSDHRNRIEALHQLVLLFFPIAIEFKNGGISEEDIKNRPRGNFQYLAKEQESHSNFRKKSEKYPESDFFNSLISNKTLNEILSDGLVKTGSVRSDFDASKYFAVEKSEPAWRTIWNLTERTDDVVLNALEKFRDQFSERYFRQDGLILHAFGIQLWLSRIKVVTKTKEKIVEECKNYVDDLFDRNELEEPKDSLDNFSQLTAYDGLGYHEIESQEFKELYNYLSQKKIELDRLRLEPAANCLLGLISSDLREFVKLIEFPYSKDRGKFYNKPVLAFIKPSTFAKSLEPLSPQSQREVWGGLYTRYSNGQIERKLSEEKDWLSKVREEIAKLAEQAEEEKSPLAAYRHRSNIKYFLDPFLIDYEED